jgi:ribonuclease R
LLFGKQGRAKVHVESFNGEPISLAKGLTSTALHGDFVELRILPPKKKKFDRRKKKFSEQKARYEVRKIIRRNTKDFLGYLKKDGGRFLVEAENSRLFIPFKILGDARKGNPGDKVVAQFSRWDPPAKIPTCKILRVLGPGGEAQTDHLGILAKFGLSAKFPHKVEEEAKAVANSLTKADLKHRVDYRNIFTITIDPLDARDFDDALSLKSINDDIWEVGVHIADVSHYVRENSSIDREAKKRGNSTYLVDEVVPMLPHSLSSGICSLIEGEERLTKCVLFRFGPKGEILKSEIVESVIKSDKRLTYEQAILFLQSNSLVQIKSAKPPPSRYSGNPGKSLQELDDQFLTKIENAIQRLWSFAASLRKKRFQQGALKLDSGDIKILVDANGEPEEILHSENDESHQLVEELMLLANETIAKEFRKKSLPGIFRVHPDPDEENLEELRHFLHLFGISCGELSSRKEVTKALDGINKHPISQVLRIKFLRSLKQACYRHSPDGHYGLAKTDYLHFTSPIRRYSDLVVHRIIEEYLRKIKTKKHAVDRFESLAKHLSTTERNSVDAERESVKDKLLLMYKKEIGRNPPVRHKAIITEIGRRGFFVELRNTLARGFVPIRTLPRDLRFRVSQSGTSLIGKNPRNQLKLGQEINVVIDKVFPSDKQLDFRMA